MFYLYPILYPNKLSRIHDGFLAQSPLHAWVVGIETMRGAYFQGIERSVREPNIMKRKGEEFNCSPVVPSFFIPYQHKTPLLGSLNKKSASG